MTTVAIGDIHGMYDMLDRLLVEITKTSFTVHHLDHRQQNDGSS